MDFSPIAQNGRGIIIKTLRIMRLTLFFIFCSIMQISAKTTAQTVTLKVENEPIEKVFEEIRKQTGYTFAYRISFLEKVKTVSVSVKDISITSTLKILFKNLPFSFSITDKTISVTQTPEKSMSVSDPIDLNFITIKGQVCNEKSEPLVGASIRLKRQHTTQVSNADGKFILSANINDILIASYIGYTSQEIKISSTEDLFIVMKKEMSLMDTSIIVSTGYQNISRERSTGSYDYINNDLINRTNSTDILSRLENLTPGLIINHGEIASTDKFLIRGRSTIYSNSQPLIVLNNFPYDGDINNINPNDVESVTILKDAAAASIWGAKAGNGVIVITTKKGKSGKNQIEFNSNVTISRRPDLNNINRISSSNFIDVEKFLYSNKFYDYDITSNSEGYSHVAFTPVIQLLIDKDSGIISESDANNQINKFRSIDATNDLKEYFYRNSETQHHSINFNGGNPNINYYMSAGFDKSLSSLVGSNFNRITFRSQNTFKISNALEVDAALNYIKSDDKSGNNAGVQIFKLYPYSDLVSNSGKALEIDNLLDGRYTDTAGNGKLLDWKYRPYDEIGNTENKIATVDYLLNFGIKYKFKKGLSIEFKYQFENSQIESKSTQTLESYNTRNIINNYYQEDQINKFPVPKGDIVYLNNSEILSNQGRLQLNYSKILNLRNEITLIAGAEIKDLESNNRSNLTYGYNKRGSIVTSKMDFVTEYPQYSIPYTNIAIPNSQSINSTRDRFVSYFINGNYTFDNRYTISGSAREDAANLFGVQTNQKGVPLWSLGAGWRIDNESFYHSSILPYLNFKFTYGYNGNYSRAASAISTISYSSNFLGANYATIQSPKNEKLRWELDKVLNLAIDFEIKNKILAGSIQYYQKKATDLMASAPIDPTLYFTSSGSGSATYFANVASIKGKGFELQLNTKNINKKIKWTTTLILSYNLNTVSTYLLPAPSRSTAYFNQYSVNPIIGKPIFSVYSYKSAGLDPNTGDPQGYINKEISKNYNLLINNTKPDSLVYNGSSQPTYFGAIMNNFYWSNFSLSINISYKLGYYFRKNGINYENLFNSWNGSNDFENRWKSPGDEKHTSIPSMIYPSNSNRDFFYTNSHNLVEKGDHIRLEDIRLDYNLNTNNFKNPPFKKIKLFLICSNLGILWAANKSGIDPYSNNTVLEKTKYSVGLNVNL